MTTTTTTPSPLRHVRGGPRKGQLNVWMDQHTLDSIRAIATATHTTTADFVRAAIRERVQRQQNLLTS